jgi:hypothetical protein
MNEVWGPSETEQQVLSNLGGSLKVFFAKHKNVRQVTPAPKRWFIHFPGNMCEPMPLTVYLSGNLNSFQTKDFIFASSPQNFEFLANS